MLVLAAGTAMAAPPPCEPPRAADPQLAVIVAKATEWAERRSAEVLAGGEPLSGELRALARRAGVRHPGRVRVALVDRIRLSEEPLLQAAGAGVGLAPDAADGLTLGYALLIRRGSEGDRELMAHELRHVAQFESCGGIARFLAAHLPHLVERGYRDSPFEVDARSHARPGV